VSGPSTLPEHVPALEVRDLTKTYRASRGLFGPSKETLAVDGVSFAVPRGTSYGLVGESGSGKSSVARIVCRFIRPDEGEVLVDGEDVLACRGRDLKAFRRKVQLVFQDPFASLDPRWRVGRLIAEGMRIHGHVPRERRQHRVAELLEQVGLDAGDARRYPHEFSGGQRQRVGIARALAVEPELLVLDEPVSALDVSVQAQILSLLSDLKDELGLTYLFIAHDLAIVERFCDQLAVMRGGRIVEEGPSARLFAAPAHPYTRTLLDAIPVPDPTGRDDLVASVNPREGEHR
jgi:ABC-type glutathione transport system ATPase component